MTEMKNSVVDPNSDVICNKIVDKLLEDYKYQRKTKNILVYTTPQQTVILPISKLDDIDVIIRINFKIDTIKSEPELICTLCIEHKYIHVQDDDEYDNLSLLNFSLCQILPEPDIFRKRKEKDNYITIDFTENCIKDMIKRILLIQDFRFDNYFGLFKKPEHKEDLDDLINLLMLDINPKIKDELKCLVCYDSCKKRLKCGHILCVKCFQKILKQNDKDEYDEDEPYYQKNVLQNCPVCRKKYVSYL